MQWLKRIDNQAQALNETISGIQILSGNTVKTLACMTMFVDHFSKIVFAWITDAIWWPLYEQGTWQWEQFQAWDNFVRVTLYGVGSIAFPLFCFLLSEGFCHTKNRKRYLGVMLLFAVVSELPFDVSFFGSYASNEGTYPFYWGYQNVFFTLFLGLATLWCVEKFSCEAGEKKIKAVFLQISSVVAGTVLAELLHCDYGGQGVLFIVGFALFRKNRLYQILAFLTLYMATTGNQPTIFVMISTVILLLYNGKRGKLQLKYFFYVFYPAHIFLLYLVTLGLNQVLLG